MNESRRAFMRLGGRLAAVASTPLVTQLAGLAALSSQQSARAASVDDGYKALVCLFMAGGNDSHNWLVPLDAANYASYAAARNELAWPTARLQAIASTSQGSGRSFAMAAELEPLRRWYEAGNMAWLANVGTLVRPITRVEYQAGVGLPPKLFSHNDQASLWQSMQAEGAPSGWGGRMGDILMSANALPVFTAMSATGNAVFLSGRRATQYQLGMDGPVLVNAAQGGSHAGSTATSGALASVLGGSGSNVYEAEYLRVLQRSMKNATLLQSALGSAPVPALPSAALAVPGGGSLVLQNDSLARQLRVVAQMVAAAPGLGMRRQVFMVSLGGFDSHARQLFNQPMLMARVAQSVNWFLSALQGMNMLNKVVLFSASDFGRALASNGEGCDHGWGSHHFVAGGAVKGREIYGRFPITALGSADDVGSGRLLPGMGVTELAAALGRWMGLSATELRDVLPNLSNFTLGSSTAFV